MECYNAMMDLSVIQNVGKLVTLQKNQLVCTEGQEGDSLFILMSGKAEIVLNSYSDNVKSVGLLEAGSLFGEMSLLEHKPRTATIAIRSNNAIVLEILKEDFPIVIDQQPEIAYMLLLNLNSRMNAMLGRIEEFDKRFVFQYKKRELYQTIQKIRKDEFKSICKQNSSYVWNLLKFLSSSLDELNQIYIKKSI